jgi:hypothetical protein
MKAEELKSYIIGELDCQPKHDLYSLADAITDIAEEQSLPQDEVMKLLLANEPTSNGMSHSYGFHTAWGRSIINETQNRYYEYEGEI